MRHIDARCDVLVSKAMIFAVIELRCVNSSPNSRSRDEIQDGLTVNDTEIIISICLLATVLLAGIERMFRSYSHSCFRSHIFLIFGITMDLLL